jgi:hypothetical protein
VGAERWGSEDVWRARLTQPPPESFVLIFDPSACHLCGRLSPFLDKEPGFLRRESSVWPSLAYTLLRPQVGRRASSYTAPIMTLLLVTSIADRSEYSQLVASRPEVGRMSLTPKMSTCYFLMVGLCKLLWQEGLCRQD